MPKFVEHKIYTNLPLQEGQEAYEGWKNPPVTPQSNVYVFNLTNEKAFLNGKIKGGLISEISKPKQCAKSYPEHLLFMRIELRLVIWHILGEIGTRVKKYRRLSRI